MLHKLRVLPAAEWEGEPLDNAFAAVHDIFHTEMAPAIGNAYISLVATCMIVAVVFATYNANWYMDSLVR